MPVLTAPTTWTHEVPNVRFRSLATPRRGTAETSVWRASLAPGAAGAKHSVTREEIFVVLSGVLNVAFESGSERAEEGDAIVVPPNVEFALSAEGERAAEVLCCLPVGGQARLSTGELITPPWAQ